MKVAPSSSDSGAAFFDGRQEYVGTKDSLSPSRSIKLHPIPSHHLHSVCRHCCHSHPFRAWCENPFNRIFSLPSPPSIAPHRRPAHPNRSEPVIKTRGVPADQSASRLHEQQHLSQTLGLKTLTPSLYISRSRPRERASESRAAAWCQKCSITGLSRVGRA